MSFCGDKRVGRGRGGRGWEGGIGSKLFLGESACCLTGCADMVSRVLNVGWGMLGLRVSR